jgi:hypothetical protein
MADHSVTFNNQKPASSIRNSYWAVKVPSASDESREAFCYDLDHYISSGRNYDANWVNLLDLENTREWLNAVKLGQDEELGQYCDLMSGVTSDPTLFSQDMATQLSITASWCDMARVLKYRGALLWMVNNRENYESQGLNNCNPSWRETQAAIWYLIENRWRSPISGTDRACTESLAATALANNEYCPACADDVRVPILLKPKTCTDDNYNAGTCKQQLITTFLVSEVEGVCDSVDPVDPTPTCECEEWEVSEACLPSVTVPADALACECVSFVPGTPGVCTKIKVGTTPCPDSFTV